MSGSRSSKPYLESPRHPIVQELRRLLSKPAERRARGRFVIEGRRLVEDALSAGLHVEALLVAAELAQPETGDPALEALMGRVEAAGGRVYLCGPRVVRAFAETETPQGVVAVASGELPALPSLDRLQPPVVMLDGVQDPGNVGTILRSAAAAGAGAVVLNSGCADLLNPKVIRASAGALFRIPAARLGEPGALARMAGELRVRGWAVLGLDPHRGRVYYEVPLGGAVALVLGSEARGISPELAQQCTGFLKIALARGVESLNVAAAAAVVLFEAARQRATSPS